MTHLQGGGSTLPTISLPPRPIPLGVTAVAVHRAAVVVRRGKSVLRSGRVGLRKGIQL